MMSHFYKVLFKKIVIIKKERYTLMQTGRTRYSENRSIAVFSCINFQLNQTSNLKQTGIYSQKCFL